MAYSRESHVNAYSHYGSHAEWENATNFLAEMEMCFLNIMSGWDRNQGNLHPGPVYNMQTSSDEEMVIASFALDLTRSQKQVKYYLFAQDLLGTITGLRRVVRESNFSSGTPLEIEGSIVTKPGTRGIATPLELANFDLLNREAGKIKTGMIYKGSDDNIWGLRKLEEELSRDPLSESLQLAVRKKRQERIRWLSLYGPQGKLGFDTEFKKQIEPETAYAEIPTGEVTLKRVDVQRSGRQLATAVILKEQPVTNSQKYREQSIDYFSAIILPQLVCAHEALEKSASEV